MDGVMHACGHDGHTAALLAVARTLVDRRAELAGEVRLIFEHAAELPPGGAAELVAAGAVGGVDAVIGADLMSTLEVGRVGVRDGPCTAAADVLSTKIVGRGGHGGFPHEAVDPIAVAAQAVTNLQHVVSRNTPPLDSVVVSVTRMRAARPTTSSPGRSSSAAPFAPTGKSCGRRPARRSSASSTASRPRTLRRTSSTTRSATTRS
jgi:amidohydrolase